MATGQPKHAASQIFILSPATAHGGRARVLTAPDACTPAARQLRSAEGMPLGVLFRHLSGLYFNGKLAYARTFARPPLVTGVEGVYVLTMTDGLVSPDRPVHLEDLLRFASAERGSDSGRRALEQSVRSLAARVPLDCGVIFLGAIGSGKYTDILLPAFENRLLFPRALIGVGQLDRGALLLDCVSEGRELDCVELKSELPKYGVRGNSSIEARARDVDTRG